MRLYFQYVTKGRKFLQPSGNALPERQAPETATFGILSIRGIFPLAIMTKYGKV